MSVQPSARPPGETKDSLETSMVERPQPAPNEKASNLKRKVSRSFEQDSAPWENHCKSARVSKLQKTDHTSARAKSDRKPDSAKRVETEPRSSESKKSNCVGKPQGERPCAPKSVRGVGKPLMVSRGLRLTFVFICPKPIQVRIFKLCLLKCVVMEKVLSKNVFCIVYWTF